MEVICLCACASLDFPSHQITTVHRADLAALWMKACHYFTASTSNEKVTCFLITLLAECGGGVVSVSASLFTSAVS